MTVTRDPFYGRGPLLKRLRGQLAQTRKDGNGQMLAVRGRRQSGKSRLFTELVEASGLPYIFFTAVKDARPPGQMEGLVKDAATSTRRLPDAGTLFATPPEDWRDALDRLALACRGQPTIVVFDEFPWACDTEPTLEGLLQNVWDKQLQHEPVLWVLIGSDVTMMERLTGHDRPLYGRAGTLVVRPFNPAECAEVLGTAPAPLHVFDAYLVTGGYPRLAAACAKAGGVHRFVAKQLSDENNDLVVVGERSLDAEFPEAEQVRRVLSAMGGHEVGHPTFSQVVGKLSGMGTAAETATTRALRVLSEVKDVVSIDRPVGAPDKTKLRRYRINDPYLRFWFRFVERQMGNITRGRPDIAVTGFKRDWPSWRGKAIEPVVHEAVLRLAADGGPLAGVDRVGSWWNRDGSREYDVVAADRKGDVPVVGSVKWRERSRFTSAELHTIAEARAVVPRAAAAKLLAVCPAGIASGVDPDLVLTPGDLLAAWRL